MKRHHRYITRNVATQTVASLVAVLAVLAAQPAAAQPATAQRLDTFFLEREELRQLALRFGVGQSDNLLRLAAPTESTNYTALGLTGAYVSDQRRVDIDFFSDLEFRDYSSEFVDDEPYGALDALIRLHAMPDRVIWVIENNYGQGRTDPFEIDGPLNREQINIFSTGPELLLPLGDRTQLNAGYFGGTRRFEDSTGLDSDTEAAQLGLMRSINTTTQLGLQFEIHEVDYGVDELNNEITDAYLSYIKTLASGRASLAVGQSQLDQGGMEETTPYLSAAWERDLASRSRLSITLDNGYVDAAETFRLSDFDSLDSERIDDVLLSADIYEQSSLGLSFGMQLDRSSIIFGGSYLTDDYVNNFTLNNDQIQFDIDWQRSLTARLQLGLTGSIAERTFDTRGQVDKDKLLRLWLRRQFDSRLSVEFVLERDSRSGDATSTYDENSFRIYGGYDFGGSRNREQRQ